MKTSRYIEAQILAILRQAEGGMPVAELCWAHGMSSASFYKWRAKYGGIALRQRSMKPLSPLPLFAAAWSARQAVKASARVIVLVSIMVLPLVSA